MLCCPAVSGIAATIASGVRGWPTSGSRKRAVRIEHQRQRSLLSSTLRESSGVMTAARRRSNWNVGTARGRPCARSSPLLVNVLVEVRERMNVVGSLASASRDHVDAGFALPAGRSGGGGWTVTRVPR